MSKGAAALALVASSCAQIVVVDLPAKPQARSQKLIDATRRFASASWTVRQ